jgi:hypothetical protein
MRWGIQISDFKADVCYANHLLMQTIETVIGSTSKRHGDEIILQCGSALGLSNHIFANSPSHASAPLPLDVDPMAQIGISIICIRK